MPVIEVVKRFVLTTADEKQMEYLPGRYEVSDEIANHFYVQPHLKGFAEPEVPPVQAYAQSLLKVEQAVRMSEPVAAQEQKPAPSAAEQAQPEQVIFAGKPVEDKPMPAKPEVAFVRSKRT